jgi:hypothetical protein
LDEINQLGIGTVLDPYYLTSAAVEANLITQAILTDAQTIAAGSVTKITSLAMENLAVVHHMLIFEYTQMSSETQFVAAMGSLREFAPMTSIAGNVGDGAASLSFVNTTSFSSPSVERAFDYRGQGYCAEETGAWGIYLEPSIQSIDPKLALDICLNLCEEYEWCLGAAADASSGHCKFKEEEGTNKASCQRECKKENHCCNHDESRGSNQKLSCLQACMVRVSGVSKSECDASCTTNGCSKFGYSLCLTCNDVPAHSSSFGSNYQPPPGGSCSATFGSNQNTCLAGCSW